MKNGCEEIALKENTRMRIKTNDIMMREIITKSS